MDPLCPGGLHFCFQFKADQWGSDTVMQGGRGQLLSLLCFGHNIRNLRIRQEKWDLREHRRGSVEGARGAGVALLGVAPTGSAWLFKDVCSCAFTSVTCNWVPSLMQDGTQASSCVGRCYGASCSLWSSVPLFPMGEGTNFPNVRPFWAAFAVSSTIFRVKKIHAFF